MPPPATIRLPKPTRQHAREAAVANPDCLLAGSFFGRGRRSVSESPAIAGLCRHYNPPVAGRSWRGTGNLTGPEQAINRSLSGRNRREQAGQTSARDRARPGCEASPAIPSTPRGKWRVRAMSGDLLRRADERGRHGREEAGGADDASQPGGAGRMAPRDRARPHVFIFLPTPSESFDFFPRRLPKYSISFKKFQFLSRDWDLTRTYGRMNGKKNLGRGRPSGRPSVDRLDAGLTIAGRRTARSGS